MTKMGSVIMESKKALRIRLCFEEPGMLRKWQIEQGLAKSWYLVTPHIVNIGHLAFQISVDFQLPYDVALEMGGFALPPLQPLSLLLDSDLVSVRHKQYPSSSAAQSRELITNSLSVDEDENNNGARFGGVELRALNEFEKETEGYQSEHEEEENDVLAGSRSMIGMQAAEDFLKGKRSSVKKRKRPHSNMDIHGKGLELTNGNDGRTHLDSQDKHKEKSSRKEKSNRIDVRTHEKLADEFERLVEGDVVAVGPVKEKGKKKKKKEHGQEKIGPHDMDSIGDTQQKDSVAQVEEARSGKKRKLKMVQEAMDLQQSLVKPIGEEKAPRKNKSARGSVMDGGLEPGTDEGTPEEQGGCSLKKKKSKKIKGPISEDAEAGREARKKEKSEEGRKGGEVKVHNNQKVQEETNVDESKKPSRSARRKKAKRRWLREQKQSGILCEQDGAEKHLKRQLSSNESETSEEGEEVEAEEERLPVMIAPGHILFESADEDEQNQRRALLPVLRLSDNVRCKRQGQAWGQEKTDDKQFDRQKNHENNYERRPLQEVAERSSFVDVNQSPVVSETMFEKLPPLKGAPQVGDVLAYRLVELTASWTPELSTYRVGKVTSYEGKTKMVTLIPLALYPIYAQAEDLEMDAQQDEDLYLPPYNHDGTLEVAIATLMEVRVFEKGPDVMPGSSEGTPQAQNSIHASVTDPASTRSAGLAVPLQLETLSKNAEASSETVSENLNVLIEEDKPQCNNGHPTSNVVDIVEKEEIVLTTKVLPVEEPQSNAAWQDILSQELNKKKLELSRKLGKKFPDCEAQDLVMTQAATVSENMTSSNKPSETGKVLFGKNGEPLLRHRHMRTGALGHTLALLRASQAL